MTVLNLNSVGSLTIDGILTRNGHYTLSGPTVSLFPEVPSRPQSTLPLAQNLHATATLGEWSGHGQVAQVYELSNVQIQGSALPVDIPPLVVKVAFKHRVASLAREAWFYDELESLQGPVVPRCYGWFEMDLRTSPKEAPYTVIGWPKSTMFGTDPCIERELSHERVPHAMLVERDSRRDILSILVLEKLGNTLRWKQSGKLPKGTYKDVYALYHKIAQLGISMAEDISLNDILRAPPPPIDAQSVTTSPGPDSGTVNHMYRIIDFDMAVKTNRTPEILAQDHDCEITQMFDESRP
ncbi:hypothetical protein OF83DRAFT_1174655 [Amylostereum chailletii]|nr:hypothetical protein OF83DRAFT_1174655 [Amylostereum chailletii]